MSWLARSLVSSLRGDDDGGGKHEPLMKEGWKESSGSQVHSEDEPPSPSRSVKEDLSELTKTITRQLWGVASFLAPPPDIQSDRGRLPDPSDSAASGDLDEPEVAESPRITGIRSDFAELGGRFKSGISMLSNTKAVSEISKIASTFLPFGDDDADEEEGEPGDGAVGITDDVLLFVRNISMHPETWLDFPLITEDEDSDDFKMSDAQQEHGLAVERLEPRLAALRIELCPSHMSEGCFWKIYFVLLHSRLNMYDAELLSTPQIMQARAMLLQDLHSCKKPNTKGSGLNSALGKNDEHDNSTVPGEGNVNVIPVAGTISSPSSPPAEVVSMSVPIMDIETEKHPVETTVVTIVDKSVIEEDPVVQAESKDLQADVYSTSKHKDEENEDDWLDEETGEASGSGGNALPLGNDEEVSFSDLEEDDDCAISKPSATHMKDPRGWVQLNNNSGSPAKRSDSASQKNKDDWLNVDDVDVE